MSDLTLVERSVLLVLLAESRPLREWADLHRVHGINLTKRSREKLQRLDLIATTQKPITHTLTPTGWSWASAEIKASRPRGQMSLGALYAVLNALGRFAEREGLTLADIFDGRTGRGKGPCRSGTNSGVPQHERSQKELLLEASLVDVDGSLALVLQDQPVLDGAIIKLRRRAPDELNASIKSVEAAANLVLQWANRAAEKRSISVVSNQGDEVPFDPVLYDADEPIEEGAPTIVRKVPVVRSLGGDRIVLVRGLAEPV